MRVAQRVFQSDNPDNQDFFFQGPGFAALLDGSTPLASGPGVIDVRDFLRVFAGNFSALQGGLRNLSEAVGQAIRETRAHYLRQSGADPAACPGNASASIAVVRELPDAVQVYCLGDCTAVLLPRGGGAAIRLRPDQVSGFDNAVLRRMAEVRAQTGQDLALIARTPEIRALLLRNRRLLNTPGGYWILSFDEEAAGHGICREFPAGSLAQIVLHTDGFDRFSRALEDGNADLPSVYRALREFEALDAGCNLYPRFKQSDDASAVRLVFA